MTHPRSHRDPRSRVWLRVLVTFAFLATAAAGLATGWFVGDVRGKDDRTADVGVRFDSDHGHPESLNRLVMQQATAALNAKARQVLRGRQPRTAAIPFVRYSLRLAHSASPSTAQIAAGRFRAKAVLRYQLAPERVVVGRTLHATFTAGRAGWQLAHLGTDGTDLWEYEPVATSTSGRSLVIGAKVYADRLPSLASQVEQARTEVAAFWTATWSSNVVVVVPSRPGLMDTLVGDDGASRLPAVATGENGPTGPIIRVTVNPFVFFDLSYLAQQIVLRHEITHVAQDALPVKFAPIWLSEGLAEYVGYRGTGIARSVIARELLSSTVTNGPPTVLPKDSAFDFGGDPAVRRLGYEQGWAACTMIADRYGEAQLVPFYRAVVSGDGSTSNRIDTASRKVLGISGKEFAVQWGSWLTENAA